MGPTWFRTAADAVRESVFRALVRLRVPLGRVPPSLALRYGIGAVAVAFALRLATAAFTPLTDNTEARYAAIALDMADSGDWITPRVRINWWLVPYLGKPPLHFWLTAASFRALGASELAARLPSLLESAAMVVATGWTAAAFCGVRTGVAASAILASAVLFNLSAGTPAPDVSLSAALTFAMCSFLLGAGEQPRAAKWLWGLGFFASLGAGFLAKGPVAVALAGFALVIWAAVSRRWRKVLDLPWITGGAVFAAIAVPWYLAAERANPGFIRYFLVNENILRFLTPNYGDRYGAAHDLPYAVTWIYAMVLFLPWSFLAWSRGAVERAGGGLFKGARGELNAYFLAWGLSPVLFFTFSSHALSQYVLPGFPGLAVVTAGFLVPWLDGNRAGWERARRWHVVGAAVVIFVIAMFARKSGASSGGIAILVVLGLAALAAVAAAGLVRDGAMAVLAFSLSAVLLVTGGLAALYRPMSENYSARRLVASVARDRFDPARTAAFAYAEPYSGDFYGRMWLPSGVDHRSAVNEREIWRRLVDGEETAVVIPSGRWGAFSPEFRIMVRVAHRAGKWTALRPRLLPGRVISPVVIYTPRLGKR